MGGCFVIAERYAMRTMNRIVPQGKCWLRQPQQPLAEGEELASNIL
jgi:hypothetical protein